MKYSRYLILVCFVFGASQLLAQSDSSFLSKTVTLLSKQLTSNATEKVYLHLDRSSYSLGDTIWFKAYAVSGTDHKPSDISGVLHVELISPIDSVIKRINLQLDAGVTWGDFTISSSFAPGIYRIKAYTNWMRNKPYLAFYDQKIRIGRLSITEEVNKGIVNPDVQFFPEGGKLINGLRSKVAVKATNSNGNGEDVSGTITDNTGAEIAVFNTLHLGMGTFALTPQTGKTYKAQIKDSRGNVFMVDLPKAQNDGFVLTVNNRLTDSINIKVNTAQATFTAKQHAKYYLIGEANGQIFYTTFFNLDEPMYIMRISKNRFPSGICRFTLFSQTGEPLNERIAFISKNDTLKLNINLPDQKFMLRQKMAINVLATDNISNPASGSFSVAIINESRVGVNEDEESTILNNLLLTSELKGYIEKPNYYFNNVTDQKRDDLDMLMLTQGYRSFEWKQLLDDKPLLTNYPAEQALQLEGSIKTPGGKPLPMGKVSLFASRENFYRDTIADINGNFKFTNVEISDTAKIVVQARKQNNGKNVSIFVKQPDFAKVDKRSNYKEADAISEGTFGQQLNGTNLTQPSTPQDSLKIKEVIIKGKKKAKDDNFNNYGTYEQRLVDMKRVHNKVYLSLEDALREIEPETKQSYFGTHSSNGNAVNSVAEPENAGKVIVDGAWRDRSTLSVFYPQEIESVRLIFQPNSNKPIIDVTTRRYAGTDTTTLKQVNIRSTRLNKKPDMSQSSNLNGAGNADQVIMGVKLLKSCARLSDCLLGKIFGVSFDTEGNPINDRSRKKMSVIINGNVIPGDALNSVNVNDIYSIEVLRGQSYTLIYGSGMSAGALVITTNHGVGNFVTSESPSGLISYPFKGYYKARVFYSPKYSTPKTNNETPDLRSTIYWNPNIITDEKGQTSFDYFNADTKGTYRIVIEGIDGFGNLGRQVYRYKVE